MASCENVGVESPEEETVTRDDAEAEIMGENSEDAVGEGDTMLVAAGVEDAEGEEVGEAEGAVDAVEVAQPDATAEAAAVFEVLKEGKAVGEPLEDSEREGVHVKEGEAVGEEEEEDEERIDEEAVMLSDKLGDAVREGKLEKLLQAEAPASARVPVAQGVQRDAPAAEKNMGAQGVVLVEPCGQKLPAGHRMGTADEGGQ